MEGTFGSPQSQLNRLVSIPFFITLFFVLPHISFGQTNNASSSIEKHLKRNEARTYRVGVRDELTIIEQTNKEVEKYDKEGNLSEKYYFDKCGEISKLHKVWNSYDKKGKLINKKNIEYYNILQETYDSTLISNINFKYDLHYKLIEEYDVNIYKKIKHIFNEKNKLLVSYDNTNVDSLRQKIERSIQENEREDSAFVENSATIDSLGYAVDSFAYSFDSLGSALNKVENENKIKINQDFLDELNKMEFVTSFGKTYSLKLDSLAEGNTYCEVYNYFDSKYEKASYFNSSVSNNLELRNISQYNEKGLQTLEIDYDGNGLINYIKIYEYDEYDEQFLLSGIETISVLDNPFDSSKFITKNIVTYQYKKFDDKNNWIERRKLMNNLFVEITIRQLSYYNY